MPKQIEVDNAILEFPDEMPDDKILEVLRKTHPAPQAPANPVQPAGVGDAARLFTHGALFGKLPQAAAAIDATAAPLSDYAAQTTGGGKTWHDRYANARKEYESRVKGSEKAEGTGTSTALELAGGLASPVGKVLPTPLRALAKGRGLLPRMAAGVGDAALGSALVEGAGEADDPKKAGQAAAHAATSPWNALGAAGPALGEAPGLFKRLSARRAWRSMDPGEVENRLAREHFGSQDQAGEFLRDAKLGSGEPVIAGGDKPDAIAGKLKAFGKEASDLKSGLVHVADQAGAQVDVRKLGQQISDVVQQELDSPGARALNTTDRENVKQFLGRIGKEIGTGKLATLEQWEALKTKLQQHVNDTAARYGRSEVAIQNNPTLRVLNRISGVIKGADEEALGGALGSDTGEQFKQAKQSIGNANELLPVAERVVDRQGTGGPVRGLAGRLLRAGIPAAAGYGAFHDPKIAAAAAAGGAALDAFGRANPRFTRIYDWLGKHLPAKPGPTSQYAPLLEGISR